MAGRFCIFFLWMCVYLMIPGRCDENVVKGRGHLEIGVKRIERKLMKKFKRVKNSLRNELKSIIKLQVREELSNLIRDESFQEIIKSNVKSEIAQVRRTVSEQDSRGALRGDEREKTDLMTCSICVNSGVMTNRLIEYEQLIGELNQTLNEMKESQRSGNATFSGLETTTVTNSPGISSFDDSESHTRKPFNPQEDRRQILVAPLWSRDENQFRLLNIQSNSVSKYPPLLLKYIISVAYVSKLDSLYICIESPLKVIASKLHSSRFKTILEGVKTSKMAVDEEKDAIFLTTYHPSHSISRMTIYGDDFTEIVNLKGHGKSPRSLALNPKTKRIYACNHDKLFMVNYDGSGLTILDTGSKINAMTLDITNCILYYGKGKKLMMMPLSTNTSSEVTELSLNIWNLVSYMDTVYYITERSPEVTIGAVYIGQEIKHSNIQTIRVADVNYFSLCLVPEF